MGGRGARSYEKGGSFDVSNKVKRIRLNAAPFNVGNSKGASVDKATKRFRELTVNLGDEISGYIDEEGFMHNVSTIFMAGQTYPLTPPRKLGAKHKELTLIHNHPGGSNRGYMGGSFSGKDLMFIAGNYTATTAYNKRVNKYRRVSPVTGIYATAPEGII